MRLTQRYNQESALLLFNLVCRSIVYHTSYYSIMNNRTWKPGDANDLNDQKKSRVTYGNGFAACNEYDPLGQLIRVNDQSDTTAGTDGTTWTYEYDCGGNILSKSRYEYTPGTLGTAQETVTYSYTDANWRDKLTGITTTNITGTTAKSISYDVIGNPLNDGEWTYTWENGRQLKEMSRGTVGQAGYMKVEYRYNSEGLRIQKIVTETTGSGTTATTTDYILHGKNIVHMIQGGDQLHFFYDASNRPAIVEFNGTKYGYIHDLQGDIVGIIDSTGTEVVKYTYDAWGKKLTVTGTLAGSLGVINPFRYRGYVYDEETGLYYLRSRYYRPEWCRFISADKLINGNLYCYCHNSPVRKSDDNGHEDYATLGPGYDLYQMILDQELILGYVPDLLQEQERIIRKGVRYNWNGQSDRGGYSCATFYSKPLQRISTQTINGKKTFIKMPTGITSMLKSGNQYFLFIVRIEDYDLSEIPEGAFFMRERRFIKKEDGSDAPGHGVTLARKNEDGTIMVNNAIGTDGSIQSITESYETFSRRYQYVAWPIGLGIRVGDNP